MPATKFVVSMPGVVRALTISIALLALAQTAVAAKLTVTKLSVTASYIEIEASVNALRTPPKAVRVVLSTGVDVTASVMSSDPEKLSMVLRIPTSKVDAKSITDSESLNYWTE